MIVVGLDVHKHSLTAAAVDELGREQGSWSGPIGMGVLAWARSLADERRWAIEDCRHVTRAIELTLSAAGERLVRVAGQLARGDQSTQTRIARELVGRCRMITRTILELDRELQQRTQTLAPRLLGLAGCGPVSAAKLLCEIGPIDRFRSDAQLARHAGVAPLDASSGKHQRHRLDRGGNRQLNCALHRIAITQGRIHAPARAYLERKQAEGKTRREA